MKKKIVTALVAIALIMGSLPMFAQSAAGGRTRTAATFSLTVNVNVPGYTLFINKAEQKGNVFQLAAGAYTILVKAAGYNDFQTDINLAADQVVNANLAPLAFPLTVNANVKGFQLFLNGAEQKGNVFQLPGGSYNITVKAAGYQDFNTSVQLNGAQTVNANLVPMTYSLIVNSNVAGASVQIDKTMGQAGQAFNLPGGSYNIKVSAPGYRDFQTSVQLNGPQTITANLVLLTFNLSISSNVKGAQVFVNNNAIGNDTVTAALAPGAYSIAVRAPGYQDFNTNVQLSGDQAVKANLQPLVGTLNIEAPTGTAIQVFVDGGIVNIKKSPATLVLPVGQHTIRYELGFVVAETQISLNNGQTLTVSPSFTILVK